MPQFFHIEVNEKALTDALFEFVVDPHASRNERPVIEEIHTFAPNMVSVLENMVIDGVEEKRFIAEYIHTAFREPGLND
jgi:hypothetical protein